MTCPSPACQAEIGDSLHCLSCGSCQLGHWHGCDGLPVYTFKPKPSKVSKQWNFVQDRRLDKYGFDKGLGKVDKDGQLDLLHFRSIIKEEF